MSSCSRFTVPASRFLFEGAYGYINVVADVADGKTVYSVSGSFNFIKDADGNPLRFADGTLSKSGLYRRAGRRLRQSVRIRVCCGGRQHLSPEFLSGVQPKRAAIRVYNSFLHFGERRYSGRTTAARCLGKPSFLFVCVPFRQRRKPAHGRGGIYYAKGDEFYPTLSYRGEPVAVYNFEEESETRWVFYSREYAGNAYSDFRYCFEFVFFERGPRRGARCAGGGRKKQHAAGCCRPPRSLRRRGRRAARNSAALWTSRIFYTLSVVCDGQLPSPPVPSFIPLTFTFTITKRKKGK